jgi:hypothetical protein
VLRPSAISYQITVHHSSVIDIRDVIYLVAKRLAAPSQDWRLARGATPKLLADRLALPPRKFCEKLIDPYLYAAVAAGRPTQFLRVTRQGDCDTFGGPGGSCETCWTSYSTRSFGMPNGLSS